MKEIMQNVLDNSFTVPSLRPRQTKVFVESLNRHQDTTRENYPLDAIYTTRRDGQTLRVYTTGNNLYESLVGEFGVEHHPLSPPRGTCVWCRQPFSNDYIPSIITHISPQRFDGYDPACSPRCAKAHLDVEKKLNPHDQTLCKAEDFLRLFCKEMRLLSEDEQLYPAPDWRLHEHNGGKLNNESFHNTSHAFVRLPGVYVVPVKLSYVETLLRPKTLH